MKVPIANFSCATFIQRMNKSHQFTPRQNICGNRQAIQVTSKVSEFIQQLVQNKLKSKALKQKQWKTNPRLGVVKLHANLWWKMECTRN